MPPDQPDAAKTLSHGEQARAPYAASPFFDEQNLPDALRKDHRTKRGTWGLLRVQEGAVKLIFLDPPSEHLVTPDCPAIIPPQASHYVVPLGRMVMQVEFFRERPSLAEGAPSG
jgi:tellurite resistance-related uncharacterized protein